MLLALLRIDVEVQTEKILGYHHGIVIFTFVMWYG